MLAARASEALPGVNLVRTQDYPTPDALAALAWDEQNTVYLIEWPQSDQAESAQRDRIQGALAIGQGLRSRLPFLTPKVDGTLQVKGRTLTVSRFLPGVRPRADRLDSALAGALGEAIAHLHAIPASALYDQGRPILSAVDSMRRATQIVDRAAQTTLLPKALLRRWEAAYEDRELWQFEPTIIHGALHLGAFLVDGPEVLAVTGWRELAVGDPARDLAWLSTPPFKLAAEQARTHYLDVRPDADRRLFQRARFWAELDIARWLLHGIDTRNEQVVEEATALVTDLHDRISGDLDAALTEPITHAPHPLQPTERTPENPAQ